MTIVPTLFTAGKLTFVSHSKGGGGGGVLTVLITKETGQKAASLDRGVSDHTAHPIPQSPLPTLCTVPVFALRLIAGQLLYGANVCSLIDPGDTIIRLTFLCVPVEHPVQSVRENKRTP